ncbi:Mo-dependent nitrogenase C-terminal domain-containing protein [Chrysosporum ovalisporum APH033B]|uniref:Mo-dependent nitrogenase C-terminal domain-containing protein n=1 Tax=Umezakia ovalisporum TaxID=75695 RepID=UPI0024767FBF|nr:Mo-dependent nitrogenase C-terminal domain-containing protein [Umezakia ovalisporum]MDH6066050.1 Mo-dependent nitrogenase C-terminal domain-containing protein [Umezakia ovalisporum APH033B]MDH6075790.1 Mo-dependent nitrogenase C-terminal domain-containing protein [Umezakia ovalisporum CS-1034]MDH6079067.1 Mo-dependent nitrogenase C-terminal domain-containing protein [Umezakia ovalisporum FSS-45]MDH6102596.1 Mo-dependent nitrogenase C-terminal domain-containing protein [Umezakia ovalisporum A
METINHTHSHPGYHPPNNQKSGCWNNWLNPLRSWLNRISIKDARLAHVICQLIPCCCPFERNISLFGRNFHIPALCKLNPLYDEFVGMRFRALSYLADECGEDITKYIC